MKKLNFTLGLLFFLFSSSCFAQTKYEITSKIHLEGEGGWDYITMDEAASRLYISHGNAVNVVNVVNNKLISTIHDTKGVHGIALAKDLDKGFISNGRDTSVTVIDLKTLSFITKIKVTGNNPDAILYDPFSHKVFTFNGRSSNSTVIDAITNKVIGTISLIGKPEFSVTDLKGKIFVNIEDKSSISEIDVNTLKVAKSWSIAPGEEPSGLAIDLKNHRLFSVCGNKLMVVSDAEAGKVVTTLPIGDRCDGVAFDPALKRAYSSNGDGTITVVQEENKDSFKVIENIVSQKGARTIAVDKTTHHLYLSTAEFEAAPEGTRRPPMKPGSFMVLDIAPVK